MGITVSKSPIQRPKSGAEGSNIVSLGIFQPDKDLAPDVGRNRERGNQCSPQTINPPFFGGICLTLVLLLHCRHLQTACTARRKWGSNFMSHHFHFFPLSFVPPHSPFRPGKSKHPLTPTPLENRILNNFLKLGASVSSYVGTSASEPGGAFVRKAEPKIFTFIVVFKPMLHFLQLPFF